jgi:ankyrin repeat protein
MMLIEHNVNGDIALALVKAGGRVKNPFTGSIVTGLELSSKGETLAMLFNRCQYILTDAKAAEFIKEGADLSYKDFEYYSPLLASMISQNRPVQLIELALKHGADPNEQDVESREAPLHVAARHGRPEIIKLLLRYRADPSKVTRDGATPLDLAVGLGGTK